MQNIIMHKQGEQSFVRWIKKRIDNNLNFLAIAEGSPGAGKSWSMLSIAFAIDPAFNPREQVAFSFRDFMRIINKFNNVDKKDNADNNTSTLNKRKYKVILFDEAQTDLSNREWQRRVNKLFNYLITTFRHQNIIVLFTSPYSDFIDSASMKLLHAKFEVKGWNKKTQQAHIRPKLLQYNSKLKKFYEHSLFVIRNRKSHKLVNWLVNKPPEHLIIPYEQMKSEFTQKLNQQITAELEELDTSDSVKEKDGRVMLDPTSLQAEVWAIAQQGYTTQRELANRVSKTRGRIVTQADVAKCLKSMQRKGYDFRIYKQKRDNTKEMQDNAEKLPVNAGEPPLNLI